MEPMIGNRFDSRASSRRPSPREILIRRSVPHLGFILQNERDWTFELDQGDSPCDPAFPGGCEGIAMLNRNSLSLSALSNRLNLGTRSLAYSAASTMAPTPSASVTSIMTSCVIH